MSDVINIFDKKKKEKEGEEEEFSAESVEAKNKANAKRLKEQRIKDNAAVMKSYKLKKKK